MGYLNTNEEILERRHTMKPLKAKVSITIDHNIVGELKDLADEDDRSLSQYINMILKAYLNKLHQSSGQSSKNPPHA